MIKTYSITLQHPRFIAFMLIILCVVIIAFCIKMAWIDANFAGQYNPITNQYVVQGRDYDMGTLQAIAIHESAHKFWFKDMTEAERFEYKWIFNDSNEFVSDYARTNELEDFADTIAYNTICELDITSMPANRQKFFRYLGTTGIVKIVGRPN